MNPTAQVRVWRLAIWAGRLLLLGAVAFWWGAVVIPQLLRLSFPDLLPAGATPWQLNPDREGNVATVVSSAGLSIMALLALAAAVRSGCRQAGWVAVGGWTALAATGAFLAWDEVAVFHETLEPSLSDEVISRGEQPILWPLVLSPLIVAFAVVMGLFVRKELHQPAVRAPFVLGLVAWLLAVAHEASYPFVFSGRAYVLEIVIEETLEFGGTLLFGLSAAVALRSDTASQNWFGRFAGRHMPTLLFGTMATVVVLGGLAVVFVFRALLIDARAPSTAANAFVIRLDDQESVAQGFRMPAAPVRFLDLRLSNCARSGPSGTAAVRVTESGATSSVLSEGSVKVPVGDCPRWHSVELLPPLTATEGQRLVVQVVADVEQGSDLGIGATKNRYAAGRLWVNGEPAWPDQNLDFAAYGAAEPSASKFHGLWRLFRSDWRWPVLAADLVISLTLITLIPLLLAASVYSRRPRPSRFPRTKETRWTA